MKETIKIPTYPARLSEDGRQRLKPRGRAGSRRGQPAIYAAAQPGRGVWRHGDCRPDRQFPARLRDAFQTAVSSSSAPTMAAFWPSTDAAPISAAPSTGNRTKTASSAPVTPPPSIFTATWKIRPRPALGHISRSNRRRARSSSIPPKSKPATPLTPEQLAYA